MKHRLAAFALALMLSLILVLPVTAYSNAGSINITMNYRGEVVSGGTLTLYFVADAGMDSYFYGSSSFAGCGYSLGNIYSESLADNLADYANNKGIQGSTLTIDENGKASFTGLKEGLYLLVQNEAAMGFNEVNPFLVTIPYAGKYNVDATPKLDNLTKSESEQPEEPEESDSEEIDDGDDSDKEDINEVVPPEEAEKLPQTGQLNWPVPVLAVSGLMLFAFGWCLHRANRE